VLCAVDDYVRAVGETGHAGHDTSGWLGRLVLDLGRLDGETHHSLDRPRGVGVLRVSGNTVVNGVSTARG